MKKRISIIACVALAMSLLGGCGSDVGKELSKIKVEKYVTLGTYKGIEVSVADYEVSEQECLEISTEIYNEKVTAENGVTNREVVNGDWVNIDYEGKLDGVAFEGGTAAGQQLKIGSNSFIDGFEAGLIGVMPGETVDLDLTFPEQYHSADLAGQAVVFTVTVNYIYPSETEWSDEFVASWGEADFSTVEGLKQYAKDYLTDYNSYYYQMDVENAVVEKFIAQCVFNEIPEELVAEYSANLQSSITAEATAYGMDADTLCYYYYGMDLATFLSTYAESTTKQSLAFQAVANAENLNLSDEELDAKLTEAATANGYATVEEFMGVNTKEDYKEYFMIEDVVNFLVENAVVTTVK